MAVELRRFPERAAHGGQLSRFNGFVVQPSAHFAHRKGMSITFSPFYRFDDADPERSHGDLREASLALWGGTGGGQWELRAGVDRVFWGVVESQHLIDIVNQTDLVEHPDEKARLGQPMVRFSYSADWGELELIGLPLHRQRTFPGRSGRLRPRFAVDPHRATYESGAEEHHFDVAARYSRSLGVLDIGVSGFSGTSREPFLMPGVNVEGGPVLAPHYKQIRQVALDLQVVAGPSLLKLESIGRAGAFNRLGEEEDYTAFVVGGEYALLSAFGTPIDVTLIAEWSYDQRERRATTRYENDVLLATRIGLNDFASSELTVSALLGQRGSRVLTAEFNRRVTDRWKLHLGAFALLHLDESDILRDAHQDSFVELGVTYSF